MGVENKFDYAAVIADLKAKRMALDGLIGSFEAAQAQGALGHQGEVSLPHAVDAYIGDSPVDLPVGILLGKSIPAAIKMYLGAVKKKMTNREIANALSEHGVESTSDNFEGVVSGALKRLKESGELLRFKDGWALAELYPEHLRNRISKERKPARKKSKTKKTPEAKAQTAPKLMSAPKEDTMPGPQALIERFFSEHPTSAEFSLKELTEHLHLKVQTVGLITSKLAHKGWLEKTDTGKFRRPAKP